MEKIDEGREGSRTELKGPVASWLAIFFWLAVSLTALDDPGLE